MCRKVIVMDNGRIIAKGSPGHVASVWPELNQTNRITVQATSQTASVVPYPVSAKDRWHKLRLVAKMGYIFNKSSTRVRTTLVDSTSLPWRRRSCQFNSMSLHMSHDLPLLTDDLTADHFEPIVTPYGRQRARSISSRSNLCQQRSHHMSSLTTSATADESFAHPNRSVSFSFKLPVGFSLLNRRMRSVDRDPSARLSQTVSLYPSASMTSRRQSVLPEESSHSPEDNVNSDPRPSVMKLNSAGDMANNRRYCT